MVQSIAKQTEILEINQLQKGLKLVGLMLSELEVKELNLGNIISLGGRDLSEIGSVFILASAISALNLGKGKKKITYEDLPKGVQDCASCSGITIYCWNSDLTSGKRCLYLTLVDGKPAIRICCQA